MVEVVPCYDNGWFVGFQGDMYRFYKPGDIVFDVETEGDEKTEYSINVESLKTSIGERYSHFKERYQETADQYQRGLMDGLELASKIVDRLKRKCKED